MSKTWDKESLLALLAKSDQAVVKALITIYNNQTASEQSAQQTHLRNNVGFNSRDAKTLTDIAQRLPRYNNHMTPRQIALVRGRIRKYWRQLLDAIPADKREIPEKVLAIIAPPVEDQPASAAGTPHGAPARSSTWGAF